MLKDLILLIVFYPKITSIRTVELLYWFGHNFFLIYTLSLAWFNAEVLELKNHINTSNIVDPQMHNRTVPEPVFILPDPSITHSSTYFNFPKEPLAWDRKKEEIQAHLGDKQALEAMKDLLLVIIGAGALGRLQFDPNQGAPSVLDINDVVHLLCDKIEKIDSQDMENKVNYLSRILQLLIYGGKLLIYISRRIK